MNTPIYVGCKYEETATGQEYVIISLSCQHHNLRARPLVVFQFAQGQAPDIDRSNHLSIDEFKEQFRLAKQ